LFQVSNAAGDARAEETNRLKYLILEYIYKNPKKGSRFPAKLQAKRLIISDSKALRGFQNIDTANLLCPLRLKEKFEQDPQ